MAYYLTDPYHSMPKSYPFTGTKVTCPSYLNSHRLTQYGRQVQTQSAIRRLHLAHNYFQREEQNQKNLLKAKYEVLGDADGERMASLVASRSCKNNSHRNMSHNFPNFIKSVNIIKEIVNDSKHAKPL